ncbi:hypothetical protein ACFV2H_07020 [Streptomyces sp. NPDC059629]|uniref:hypothetical protein n=1 Tax=Streptomyces sp. NPDC059629 TaxID=3346889 RepID=UPI0036B3265B
MTDAERERLLAFPPEGSGHCGRWRDYRQTDEDSYEKRITVERAINRLKRSRTVATRHDKRGYVFLGTVTKAPHTVWLRS